jgi:NitT/TauT family transport system ATP-binding protein
MTNFSIDITNKTYPATATTAAHVAINNLHINLKQNEFVCLVGPSGCGKTTLMNILAGIDQNYDGEVYLGDENTHDYRVGYVFQEPRLLPWCSVLQNIELVLDNKRNTKLVNELLEIMEITDLRNHYPTQISLGMARRVALARAFVTQPHILLMDEPFVSLDASNAKRIRQRLINVWQAQPHTILFVTHDIREAIILADRILFLDQAPTQVIAEVEVTIPRDNRTNENAVSDFRHALIENHPEIADYC